MARPADPVTSYAQAVVSGEIMAGRLVRLACARHLRDLEEGPKRGLVWKPDLAERIIRFFSHLRLADGGFEGQPFHLQPFQQFVVGSLFGWVGTDGFRRFRTAYCEMGKGSGKSPLAGGVGLYGLVADSEPAAEIYSAATTREQAGILFRDAKRLVDSSPSLKSRVEPGVGNLAYGNSFFRPVSSEHKGLDGKRPHMALIDEVHEHPTPLVVDKMRAGTKNRRQALIFEITNSGHDRTTVCWHHHDYSARVLEGTVNNDSWFAYVCQLDPCEKCRGEGKDQPSEGCEACDDWRDEKVWLKANPGLGTILPSKYLREQVEEARGMPAKEAIVKRLNFCVWTEVATRAIPVDKWDACAHNIDTASLRGRECYGGLDIGSTSDFTAFVLFFPHDDSETVSVRIDPKDEERGERTFLRRSYTLLPFFWLPQSPRRRDEKTAATIEMWRRQGHIRTTPGEVVDYDVVLDELKKISQVYDLKKLAFDRGFQGCQMGTNLMKEFGEKVIESFPQGILSMAAPFREFLELIILGRLHHGDDPVMRWMISNCAAEQRGGLIKPSKDHSAEKIDGVTAAVMALAKAMTQVSEEWYQPGCLLN